MAFFPSLPLDEVQRKALRAAAKVALAMSTASVFGACGGAMQSDGTPKDDADPTDDAAAESGQDAIAVDHPVPDAVVEATACGTFEAETATPSELDCCAAEVRATFPPDVTGPIDAGTPSADLVACCAAIVDAYNPSTEDLGLTYQQANACCYVLPGVWYEHGGVACTPWGPPMPPPMPSSRDEREDRGVDPSIGRDARDARGAEIVS